MEAACLGLFMVSACAFTVLLYFPGSPVSEQVADPLVRRMLVGLAMGLTLLALVYSPWGKQSGAHMNPAVTLTYLSLGKVAAPRALFYVLGQVVGGVAGVLVAWLLLGPSLVHYKVNFAVTQPGPAGPVVAWLAEMGISTLMMLTVLLVSNSRRYSRWTPFAAATLLFLFITLEAPFSGMSMNPARSFGSAFAAREWDGLWIYFSAPFCGMLAAAGLYRLGPGIRRVYCAKLHHHNNKRCLFHCNYGDLHVES